MSRVLPILFNTDMVRAILDGSKTVTRRVIKKSQCDLLNKTAPCDLQRDDMYALWHSMTDAEFIKSLYTPPYQPGDILYVRESYCPNYFDEHIAGYRSGDNMRGNRNAYKADYHKEIIGDAVPEPKWKPSIHMPKEAARIWLKVTGVRVERLQEITEEQALSEGVPDSLDYPISKVYCPRCHGNGLIDAISANGYMDVDCPDCDTAIKRFKNLWNSTIKKSDLCRYGWDANPYVFVIEFERCEKP